MTSGREVGARLPGLCVPSSDVLLHKPGPGFLFHHAHPQDGKECNKAGWHLRQVLMVMLRDTVMGGQCVTGACSVGSDCGQWLCGGCRSSTVVRGFLLTSLFCSQGIESENVNVVKRLFKIQNLNASTIRTVMVADCSRYDSPDLLLDYEEQLAASSTSTCPVFDLGSDSEEEESKPKQTPEPAVQEMPDDGGVPAEDELQQFFDDIMGGCVRPAMTEAELENKVAELFICNRTKPPEVNLLSTDSNSKTKYLIFTTGCLTYSPHQIGKAVVELLGTSAFLGVRAAATLWMLIWKRPVLFTACLW